MFAFNGSDLCALWVVGIHREYGGGLETTIRPGATTVVFAPFLLLFIALALIIFVAGPMFAAAIGAILGGLLLRWRALSISRSTIRSFVFASVVCHIILIALATRYHAPFLPGRPREHPKTPTYALACVAGANAALNSLVAVLIIRRLTTKGRWRSSNEVATQVNSAM
jgi:hypothetical protein